MFSKGKMDREFAFGDILPMEDPNGLTLKFYTLCSCVFC